MTQAEKSGKWFYIEAAQPGDLIVAYGGRDKATIIEVYPNYGVRLETMSPGYKLQIVYSIKELSDRSTKWV